MWFWQRWRRDSDNLERIKTILESLVDTSIIDKDNEEAKAELVALNPSKPISKEAIANKLSNQPSGVWEEDELTSEESEIFYAET